MKKVEMYRAKDGTLYETAEDCVAHERNLDDLENIGSFLNSAANPYEKSAHRTVAENTLKCYMAWLRGVEAPIIEEKFEDSPL